MVMHTHKTHDKCTVPICDFVSGGTWTFRFMSNLLYLRVSRNMLSLPLSLSGFLSHRLWLHMTRPMQASLNISWLTWTTPAWRSSSWPIRKAPQEKSSWHRLMRPQLSITCSCPHLTLQDSRSRCAHLPKWPIVTHDYVVIGTVMMTHRECAKNMFVALYFADTIQIGY